MKTDSYFCIGASHIVCQDYAVSGPNYAFIFDGCSGAPNSEVASALAGRLTEHAVSSLLNIGKEKTEEIVNREFEKFYMRAKQHVGVDLDTTACGWAVFDRKVFVQMCGDPVIYLRFKDGLSIVAAFDFAKSMPILLSYILNPEAKKAFEQESSETGNVWTSTVWTFKDGKNRNTEVELPMPTSADTVLFEEVPLRKVASATMFSDGVNTFGVPVGSPEYFDILDKLTTFKSTNGRFVQRTARRRLRELAKDGLVHQDDFSMATIIFDE